jgi:hypothetical protein
MRAVLELSTLLMLVAVPVPQPAAQDQKPAKQERKTVRVLCVGNSYTDFVAPTLDLLVKQAKLPVEFEYVSPGGALLRQHLADDALLGKIRDGKYDCVVLQEQSQFPSLSEKHRKTFHNAARGLHEVIKKSGARTAFFVTWGRRDGDSMYPDLNPDFETMQARLDEGYATVIKELGAVAMPVGAAWAEVKKSDKDLWRKLYIEDGSHPSTAGAYASALVLLSVLLEQAPEKLDEGFEVEGVAKKDRETIRKAVVKALAPAKEDKKKDDKKRD